VKINRLDHFVLTVADIDATVAFYTRQLGMEAVTFGEGRTALALARIHGRTRVDGGAPRRSNAPELGVCRLLRPIITPSRGASDECEHLMT
jgi:catechol 2,3-dioxygenase-like lactoylglutathione lyase family enzyme